MLSLLLSTMLLLREESAPLPLEIALERRESSIRVPDKGVGPLSLPGAGVELLSTSIELPRRESGSECPDKVLRRRLDVMLAFRGIPTYS